MIAEYTLDEICVDSKEIEDEIISLLEQYESELDQVDINDYEVYC